MENNQDLKNIKLYLNKFIFFKTRFYKIKTKLSFKKCLKNTFYFNSNIFLKLNGSF